MQYSYCRETAQSVNKQATKWTRKLTVRMLLLLLTLFSSYYAAATAETKQQQQQPHSSNHAVILSSSRYWFNYRHTANALSLYQMLRGAGFDDDHIVLMIADEFGVNPRNPVKNRIYNTAHDTAAQLQQQPHQRHHHSHSFYERPPLMLDDTQLDYRGEDVTVDNFVRVLTGRGGINQTMPVLNSDENSNVFVYMTGHGGDQFFKFQDVEEILAEQLAETVRQMHVAGKYRHLLLLADTCQAFTLFDKIIAQQLPSVSVIGSSLRDQSSYAHQTDPILGLSVIEKYTHFFTEYMRKLSAQQQQQTSLWDALIAPYTRTRLGADLGWAVTAGTRNFTDVPLSDFFLHVENTTTDKNPPSEPRLVKVPTDKSSPDWTFSSSSSNRRRSALSREKNNREETCATTTTTKTTTTTEECLLFIANDNDNSTASTIAAVATDFWLQQLPEVLPGTEPSHPIFVAAVAVFLTSTLVASLVW